MARGEFYGPWPRLTARRAQYGAATAKLRPTELALPSASPRPSLGAAGSRTPGAVWARSHCRFVLLLIHFIPDLLTYLVPLFLKRQCDRTLGAVPGTFITVPRLPATPKVPMTPRLAVSAPAV